MDGIAEILKMKRFNTTGKCIANRHYMVPIDRQVEAAAQLIEDGLCFCINRGRQYGKTTTLAFPMQYYIFHALMILPIMIVVGKLNIPMSFITAAVITIGIAIGIGVILKIPYVKILTNPSSFFLRKIHNIYT